MRRERGAPKPKRKQLGILFNEDLWFELRALALKKRRTGTHLMEQAVREYLERHDGDTP